MICMQEVRKRVRMRIWCSINQLILIDIQEKKAVNFGFTAFFRCHKIIFIKMKSLKSLNFVWFNNEKVWKRLQVYKKIGI
jgi:mannitol-1-phosphate/altronate dehydrogenase